MNEGLYDILPVPPGAVPAYVTYVFEDRIEIEGKPTPTQAQALRGQGARKALFRRLWHIGYRDQASLAAVLSALRDAGFPFLCAGPGWHPASVFEDLRERGLVSGKLLEIYFTGPDRPPTLRREREKP